MKFSRTLVLLSSLVAVFALVAAGVGFFWQGSGAHYDFESLRSGTVAIQGSGLYKYESVSGAAQVIAGDLVSLCVGIPLLLLSIVLYVKGTLKGRLLLAGTLGYFLYTYASIALMAAYNQLFLLYVALFSLSLFGLILAVASIPVNELAKHFSPSFPRKIISGFMLFLGIIIFIMWMGRIAPTIPTGVAPEGLDIYSTLVIQVLDLGVVFPMAIVGGVLLLKQRPWGYVMASVLLIKGFTMSIAVSAMGISQMMAGIEVGIGILIPFLLITVLDVALTLVLFKHISEDAPEDLLRPVVRRQTSDN